VLKATFAPGSVLIKNIHSWSCSCCKVELLPESTPVLRILHTSAAKILALFLKLFLRIADIMLIISVIAVRLHTQNVDFYGRFTPSSLCFIKFLIKLSHNIIPHV